MPIDVQWQDDHVVVNTGYAPNCQTIIDAIKLLSRDQRFKEGMRILWDLSSAVNLQVSSTDLQRLGKLCPKIFVSTKTAFLVAVVTSQADIYYRIQAIFSYIQPECCEIGVFRYLEEAMTYIKKNKMVSFPAVFERG